MIKSKKYIILITILFIVTIICGIYLYNISNIGQSSILTEFKTSYTIPYLPKGFGVVEGTNLNNGLVIQDSSGNQYVWIEVPKIKEVYQISGLEIDKYTDENYEKIENDLHSYTSTYRNGTAYIDDYPKDIVEDATGLTTLQYIDLKQKMLKSIYQNGGFYVGRYETGTINSYDKFTMDINETPIIKKDVYPYGYITCSEAQKLANNMNSGEYTSSILFGLQWDLVLKYLETKGSTTNELLEDSTNWGNHYNNLWNVTNTNSKNYEIDSEMYGKWLENPYGKKNKESKVLLSTGASDSFMKQNIYDFAGNSWEYTLEYSNNINSPCTIRGGSYGHRGDTDSASYRYNCNQGMYFFSFGFRVAIY